MVPGLGILHHPNHPDTAIIQVYCIISTIRIMLLSRYIESSKPSRYCYYPGILHFLSYPDNYPGIMCHPCHPNPYIAIIQYFLVCFNVLCVEGWWGWLESRRTGPGAGGAHEEVESPVQRRHDPHTVRGQRLANFQLLDIYLSLKSMVLKQKKGEHWIWYVKSCLLCSKMCVNMQKGQELTSCCKIL